MAPMRSTPLDDPPSASSDDDETEDELVQPNATPKTKQQPSSSSDEEEEEEDDDEEEEDESEEEEEATEAVKKPLEKEPSSGEEESESEPEEETPSPVKTSIQKPKPLTPKSTSTFDYDSDLKSPNVSDFAIKPSKKINALEEATPSSKRPSVESDVKDKKKIKVSNGDVDDEKKSAIKKVWSEGDELMLLQCFIDYQSEKGRSPLSDMDSFYRYTMDAVLGNATKSQLYEKIRRLKKKFRDNQEKASNGEDPVFIKPHERELYKISKKIWGIGGCESVIAGGGSNTKSRSSSKVKVAKVKEEVKPKIKVKEDEEDEVMVAKVVDFETLYPYWCAGLKAELPSVLKFPQGVIPLIKQNWSLIGEAGAREMDEKWKAVFEEEVDLKKRKMQLFAEMEAASRGK